MWRHRLRRGNVVAPSTTARQGCHASTSGATRSPRADNPQWCWALGGARRNSLCHSTLWPSRHRGWRDYSLLSRRSSWRDRPGQFKKTTNHFHTYTLTEQANIVYQPFSHHEGHIVDKGPSKFTYSTKVAWLTWSTKVHISTKVHKHRKTSQRFKDCHLESTCMTYSTKFTYFTKSTCLSLFS